MTLVPTSRYVTSSRAGHDGPLRRRASTTGETPTRGAPQLARRREGEVYEELQGIGDSVHASHPAHRVLCPRRGSHGLAALAGPCRPCHTATRAPPNSG